MRGTHLTVLAERTRLPARTGRAVMAEVAADMVCVACEVSRRVRECLRSERDSSDREDPQKSGKKILKKQKVAAGKKRFGSAFRLVITVETTPACKVRSIRETGLFSYFQRLSARPVLYHQS